MLSHSFVRHWLVKIPDTFRGSVQKGILREFTSIKALQDALYCSSCSPGIQEFGTEAKFGLILVPHQTRFPGGSNFSWTRIFTFNASVPKKMKNKFVRTRISRSKLLYRDEKIRKNSFCAETGQLNHEPMQPNRQPTTKSGRMAAKTTSPPVAKS